MMISSCWQDIEITFGCKSKQAEKLISQELKEGWMKNYEGWIKNDEWWMMKDDDFKLLRGFDDEWTNRYLWMKSHFCDWK